MLSRARHLVFSMPWCPSCSCAMITSKWLRYQNLLSFEDDSIFNCQLIAIVPEFMHIVWYFLDCVSPTSEDDLAQTAKSRISGSFVSDLTLLG